MQSRVLKVRDYRVANCILFDECSSLLLYRKITAEFALGGSMNSKRAERIVMERTVRVLFILTDRLLVYQRS